MFYRILIKFSEVLDDAKVSDAWYWTLTFFQCAIICMNILQHGIDVDVINDDNTLGFQLDLANRYAEALKVITHFAGCGEIQ